MYKFLIFFTLISFNLISQDSSSSKFGICSEISIGNTQLYHSQFGKLNGSSISINALLNYRINERINISSGIGFISFNSNVYSNLVQSNLSNEYLHIPLNINIKSPKIKGFSENIRFVLGLGGYTNFLYESNLSTATTENKSEDLGWSFGINGNCGLDFQIKPKSNIALIFDFSKDLSEIEFNNVKQRFNSIAGLKIRINSYF